MKGVLTPFSNPNSKFALQIVELRLGDPRRSH
jgi:hypothetical protein